MTESRPKFTLLRIAIIAILTLLCAFSAFAQSNKGTIIGTVKDPNAALIPNAKITITNTATNESTEATSNADGNFIVTNLAPGTYRVKVEASGFKTLIYEAIKLETNARLPLEAKFTEISGADVGQVTVTADASLVETESSVRGDVITGRQVTELPIPQRNFTILAALTPGVTRPPNTQVGVIGGGGNFAQGGAGSSTESTRFRESGGSVISANGARVTNNNFSLDGVDNNESQFGQIAIFPNPDAIAEFKIETSVPQAESGRAGGAIVSATFKSGGNQLHGTLFEEYQGRFASAVGSQFNTTNPPPNYVTHNFGGTVGGPIFLPRFGEGTPPLYDGRDRSFFFVSLGLQRNFRPITGGGDGGPGNSFVAVPSARMRVGDFGELLNPGTLVFYRFPLNYVQPAGVICRPVVAGDTFKRCQFPKGTIFAANGIPVPGNDLRNCPTCGAFSNFGRNLVNAFPLPNSPGIGNNYRVNRVEQSDVDSYDIKIDQKITDRNSFFARYSKSQLVRSRDNAFPLGSSPTGNDLMAGFGAGEEFGNSRGITLGDTHTFSPSVLNDARFGYTRVNIGIFNSGINGANGFDPNVSANLGARNINTCGVCQGTLLLGIVDTLSGIDRATVFPGDGGPFYFLSNNFNFADAITVVKGNSVIKFGADIRVRQNSNFDGGRNGGIKGNYQYGISNFSQFDANGNEINVDGGFVSGNYNTIGPNDSGSSLANILLGYQPGFVTRGTPGGPYLLSNKEIGFFIQDDWKATPNLTLNLGLRYDLFTAPTERYNRQANFVPANRTIVVAGDGAPGGRDLADTDKNNFGPRIGFAYSGFGKDKKLVVRGGYGILYSIDISGQQPLTANPGTGAANFSCNPINNPGGCPANYPIGRYPFDTGIPFAPEIVAAPGSSFLAPTGGTIYYVDPNRKDELFHQYNLTLQYEFARNWLAEVGYVGSNGRNLLIVRNIGNANDQGGPGSRQIPNINSVVASEYTAKSDYNALQSKLEKRLSNGLSILSTYTWAHAIDDNPGGFCIGGTGPRNCGPDDPLRPELDRGNSDLDVRHRFTVASVWDIPIGRGRRFGGDMPKALDFFIGGFQFNNILSIQSGPVYSVTANGGRVDLIGNPTPTDAQRAQGIQLNRAAFRNPVTPVFANDPGGPKIGTLGRNTFRGDRQEYWDASIFKNFRVSAISEAFNVQFRFSAYNVLNHVNRSAPNADFNNTGDFGRDRSEQQRRQMEFSLKIIF